MKMRFNSQSGRNLSKVWASFHKIKIRDLGPSLPDATVRKFATLLSCYD